MPVTINGFGTRYFGKRNLVRRPGHCSHCGRSLVLEDYDTRLWVCALFIPVLPLGAKRIIEACPFCKWHRAAPLGKWRQAIGQALGQARDAERGGPDDHRAAVGVLHVLDEAGQKDEAFCQAEGILRRFPRNAEAHADVGAWYARRGYEQEAAAAFARALALDGENPQARHAVALSEISNGNPDRARELLRCQEEPGGKPDAPTFLLLADAYRKRGRDAEALEAYRVAVRAEPRVARRRQVARAIRASQRAVPLQAPVLPPRHMLRSKWVWAGVVLAAIIGGLGAVGSYLGNRRLVHVVNGLPVAVRVEVDGGPGLLVPPRERRSIRLPEGAHRVVFSANEVMTEDASFSVSTPGGFFGRFRDRTARVLNPFGAAVLVAETAYYAEPGAAPGGSLTPHMGVAYVEVPDVDCAFEALPDAIDRPKDGKMVARRRVDVIQGDAARLVESLRCWQDVSAENLLRYAEAHLTARPDDEDLLAAYVSAAQDQAVRCREFLARGLENRPIRIDWHRTYQTLCESTGGGAVCLEDYRRLSEANPGDAAIRYLYARVLGRISEAMIQTRRAIEADPDSAYGWLLKSYLHLTAGESSESLAAAEKAASLAPNHGDVRNALFAARLAARQWDALDRQHALDEQENVLDYHARMRRLVSLVARGDHDGARRAHADYVSCLRQSPGVDPKVPLHAGLVLAHLLGDKAERIGAARALADAALAAREQLQAHLDAGDCAAAMAQLADPDSVDTMTALAIAVALHADGQAEVAETWRRRAATTFSTGGQENRLLAELLRQGAAADGAVASDLAMEMPLKALGMVALVQAGADPRLLDLAKRLNCGPGFPALVVTRAIGRMRAGTTTTSAPSGEYPPGS